jgi:hypothetical protein
MVFKESTLHIPEKVCILLLVVSSFLQLAARIKMLVIK